MTQAAAQTQNAPAKQAPSSPATIAKQQVALVEQRVNELTKAGALHLPADYSAPNALRAAFLNLQAVEDKDKRPALQVCTQASITNALLSMVVQGLNVDKKQGYFVVFGQQLTFMRSYFGAMTVAQRVNPAVKEFAYAVVYHGDELEYEIRRGKRIVTKHKQKLENVQKEEIIAAYCMVYGEGDTVINSELMTFDEIKQAWKQSKAYPILDSGDVKATSTHGKFTADMALRTVINKTCKPIINASNDKELLKAVRTADELAAEHEAQADADENANGEVIDVEAFEPVYEAPVEEPAAIEGQPAGQVLDFPKQEAAPVESPLKPQTQKAGKREPGF